MNERFQERRFPRIPSKHVVLIQRLEEDAEEHLARTGGVGLGGCSVISNEPIGAGSFVRVLLSVAGDVVETEARVVYENTLDDGRIQIGVEFMRLSEDDTQRLEALFKESR